MKTKKEVRLLPARELRAAKNADGKSTLGGYAAVFNSLSDDLGGWREKIAPDAFTRTLKDQPDVYCLYAHGSQVLGRTKAGTLTLNIDAHGLHFDNTLPDTTAARDLITSIERGDVDGCSFGFFVRDDDWDEDGTGMVVRTLLDVELGEISVTPMPAYPATSVSLRSAPIEIRNKINLQRSAAKVKRDAADGDPDPDACLCACSECMDGDCENCSNTMCADPNCRCMMSRSKRSYTGNTQKVDGVDLTKDCFAYTPDDVPSHWKFPIHFPGDDEKTKSHIQNALARFSEADLPADAKKEVYAKIVSAAKAHGIHVSEEDSRSAEEKEVAAAALLEEQNRAAEVERSNREHMQMRIRLAQARRK